MESYKVIREPHITEKATTQKGRHNHVTLKVDRRANKIEIKRAVEGLLRARVRDVKTINVRGKRRRVGRFVGRRPDWKKAVVVLAPGENVEFFEGM